jgi:cytidine deaminase
MVGNFLPPLEGLSTETEERLAVAAGRVIRVAHAPYSGQRVGAATLTASGAIYAGCNVENRSYGLTLCAERSAIASAVAAEGSQMTINVVLVLASPDITCVPCGACRQVIAEFGQDVRVIYRANGEWKRTNLENLLPDPF